MNNNEIRAHHEATHAVVAVLANVEIERVRMTWDGSDGAVDHINPKREAGLRDLAMVALAVAGCCSDGICRGLTDVSGSAKPDDLLGEDLRFADRLATVIWGDSDARNTGRLRRIEQVLMPLLQETDFADAIRGVADAVLDAAERNGAGRETSVPGAVITELVNHGPVARMRERFEAALTPLLVEFEQPPEQDGVASGS